MWPTAPLPSPRRLKPACWVMGWVSAAFAPQNQWLMDGRKKCLVIQWPHEEGARAAQQRELRVFLGRSLKQLVNARKLLASQQLGCQVFLSFISTSIKRSF
jgi:hypothetical protein